MSDRAVFTPEMDQVLRCNYRSRGSEACAQILGVTPEEAWSRACELGILKQRIRRRAYTPDEDALIERVYREQGYSAALAAVPGRTAKSVGCRLHQLGLRGFSRLAQSIESGRAAGELRRLDAAALDAAMRGVPPSSRGPAE